ncbi:hypothetical protein AAIR98_000540 [Elusimicrobium simillimum]|uniref:hypothetical protein n=1 Tax=Elusimicrobium simillimum TaxID=3143438 RepID=UPI003C6F7758
MFKKVLAVTAILALACGAYAADADKRGWELDLKKISLNITSTEVKNADKYADFSDARLHSDSQTLIQGYLNMTGNYYAQKYVWANTLLAEYGRTKVRPADGTETTTNENVDRIVLTTDYTLRMWNVENFLGGFEAGPFANIEYDTEFTKSGGNNRKQVVSAGAKIFEGKYIKSLYAAGVGEYDFTYNPESTKFAWEVGFNVEQPIREGVKAVYSGYFRDYVHSSEKRNTDVDYEMELDARMDVLVYKTLSIAPFVTYYLAQAEHFSGLGQNVYVGVSFSFSHLFIKAKGA